MIYFTQFTSIRGDSRGRQHVPFGGRSCLSPPFPISISRWLTLFLTSFLVGLAQKKATKPGHLCSDDSLRGLKLFSMDYWYFSDKAVASTTISTFILCFAVAVNTKINMVQLYSAR
jgi:hypothetical protein